jgi:hypothetical protein
MAALSEAFPAPNRDAKLMEQTENPQARDEFVGAVRHVKEARHILGIVGGNEVARAAGSVADVESDLLGITRPNTWCASRKHLPPSGTTISRTNPKLKITIDATPIPLKEYQQWAYPSVIAPIPLQKDTCGQPHKY